MRTDTTKESVSVLHEVDFELELIQRDEINVVYILRLLAKLKEADNDKDYEFQYKAIMQMLGGSPELRSKQALIEQFIQSNLPELGSSEEVPDAFDAFWEREKEKATEKLCQEEGLVSDHVKGLVDRMIFTNQEPLREDVFSVMDSKPKLFQRETAFNRLTERLKGFVDTFYGGV